MGSKDFKKEDWVSLKQMIDDDEKRAAIINPFKVRGINASYEVLKKMLRGSGASVNMSIGDHYKSMGTITIIGKEMVFSEPRLLAAIMKTASNTDIYPKTDGTIVIDITYHGITTPIE